MKKDILYDIEDDVIDRGDSSNMDEALEHLNIQDILVTESDSLGTAEAAYHNSYYLGKGKYGSRSLKLGQMKKIIDEDGNYE